MKKLLHFFIFFSFVSISNAQHKATDSVVYQRSMNHAVSVYRNSVQENALYNGNMYVSHVGRLQGHPFFKSDKLVNGDLIFSDERYENVPLLYDIIRDELILGHFNNVHKIKLASENVTFFYFSGSSFVRLLKDNSKGSIPATGFYERLYDGKIPLYAKRKKILDEVGMEEILEYKIIEKNLYYIKKGNSYYPVHSKASVLNVFKDKKRELVKYLNSTRTRFRKNREGAILLLTKEYNKLTNQ